MRSDSSGTAKIDACGNHRYSVALDVVQKAKRMAMRAVRQVSGMSQSGKYNINCPKCGHSQAVELYESVNVQVSPELKEVLMANRLNVVTCAECGLSFRVDKPLLYNDPKRGVMIYLIPTTEGQYNKGEHLFAESLRRLTEVLPADFNAPGVSLVFNRFELVERIFLFDAGLNERIIEYIKYMIYSKNLGKLDPRTKNLLFDAEDSTDKVLCFVVQDVATRKLESVLQYDRGTYKALSEMFDRDEQTATLLELFPGPHISARALLLRGETDPELPEPEAAP